MSNVCKHGQLERSCEICELEAMVSELEKEVKESNLSLAHQQYNDLQLLLGRDNEIMRLERELERAIEKLERIRYISPEILDCCEDCLKILAEEG